MSIFDLHNLGLVTAIKLKSKIKSLAFTSDESTIVFAVENDLKCIKNPLKVSEVRIFGPEFEKFKFMKYITDIMLSNTPLHDEEMDLYIIEPFHINALHFYAYFNLSEHLKKGIRLGDAFYPSKRDETPLSICLKKSYTESISAIFDTVEKMSNRNMYSFYYFENSLVTLNHRGFPGLETFYNRIFVRFDKGLPKFCDSKSHFPYTVHSDFLIPKVENFTDKISFSNEGQDVMFMNSLVRFDLQMGSKESLQFLDSL